MSDLLGIGSSGVYSYQRALSTISNNIANVGTDGYSRQDVTIVSNQPRQLGPNYIGTGSRFDGIKRLYDAFLESNLRNSQSDLSSQGPMTSYVNRLINVMADQNIGLSSAMSRFFESARDLATDPASQIARNIFLRDSDGLASRFRELSSQIQLLEDESRQATENYVGKINALSNQIAQVNQQLSRHSLESKQPSELLDQRDVLLRELAKITAIKTRFQASGQVLVSVGDTLTEGVLVDGHKALRVGIADKMPDDPRIKLVLDPYGQPKSLPGILSGELGGVLRFREQVLEPATASLDDLAQLMVAEINQVHNSGIDIEGQPGQNLFGFNSGSNPGASSIQLLIDNSARVAAGSLFRVINNANNIGSAHAQVSYDTPSYMGPTQLISPLNTSTLPMWKGTQVRLNESGVASLGVIPQGMNDLTLEFTGFNALSNLQILTRDGKHLLGTPLDQENGLESKQLVNRANGMEANARYSATGLSSYSADHLGMDLFFGAKANVGQIAQFSNVGEILEPVLQPAILQSVPPHTVVGAIAKDALVLNGISLPAFGSSTTTVAEVADWLNGLRDQTGVAASWSASEGLVLSRPDGNTVDDIRLGLGTAGTSLDLQRLGFAPRLYLAGGASDDLLIFASGQEGHQFGVVGQYRSIEGNPIETLRGQKIQISFNAHDRFELRSVDPNSGDTTFLGERSFNPNQVGQVISYRGLEVQFSSAPKAGDVFTVDANRDGIGNNEAMLRLVNLEKTGFGPSQQTFNEIYIERVNQVGNVARQTAIAEQALRVVVEQARDARDAVSGVSLDEEAAALVRFQQAYQANARVMQMASTLFEAILQVR